MTRVFLTGHSGFVGSRLQTALRHAGRQLICLARSPDARGDATPDVHVVVGDLLDARTYESALQNVDVIVHLAASTGKASAADHFRTNRDGTQALVTAAREAGVPRMLFVSTIAVTFPDLTGYPYAQSKLEAERIVTASGLKTTIVRPTIVVGRGSPIVAALRPLASLPIIPVFGSGRVRVQPIDVDDLAHALADIVNHDRFRGETLELGGQERVTMDEFLVAIRHAAGKPGGRVAHLPLGLLLPLVAIGERIAGSAMPVTVGQLSSFRFDGTARPDPQADGHRRLASLAEMLERSNLA